MLPSEAFARLQNLDDPCGLLVSFMGSSRALSPPNWLRTTRRIWQEPRGSSRIEVGLGEKANKIAVDWEKRLAYTISELKFSEIDLASRQVLRQFPVNPETDGESYDILSFRNDGQVSILKYGSRLILWDCVAQSVVWEVTDTSFGYSTTISDDGSYIILTGSRKECKRSTDDNSGETDGTNSDTDKVGGSEVPDGIIKDINTCEDEGQRNNSLSTENRFHGGEASHQDDEKGVKYFDNGNFDLPEQVKEVMVTSKGASIDRSVSKHEVEIESDVPLEKYFNDNECDCETEESSSDSYIAESIPGLSGYLRVLDADTGKVKFSTTRTCKGYIFAVAATSNGRFIVVGSSEGEMSLWDVETRAQLWMCPHGIWKGRSISYLEISQNGEVLAIGDRRRLLILYLLKEDDGFETRVRFEDDSGRHSLHRDHLLLSADGRVLVILEMNSSADTTIMVMDTLCGEKLMRVEHAG